MGGPVTTTTTTLFEIAPITVRDSGLDLVLAVVGALAAVAAGAAAWQAAKVARQGQVAAARAQMVCSYRQTPLSRPFGHDNVLRVENLGPGRAWDVVLELHGDISQLQWEANDHPDRLPVRFGAGQKVDLRFVFRSGPMRECPTGVLAWTDGAGPGSVDVHHLVVDPTA